MKGLLVDCLMTRWSEGKEELKGKLRPVELRQRCASTMASQWWQVTRVLEETYILTMDER